MTGPRCIVCGKPIAKRTNKIWFRDAHNGKPAWMIGGTKVDAIPPRPHGYREDDFLYLDSMPKTKEDAQRYVNEKIVSVQRGEGGIRAVGYWDGESYQSKYFHSNECAIRQGIASAQHGDRYTRRK